MSAESARRRLAVPSFVAMVLFSILVALGVWQLHRLVWKQALLADIEAALHAPPVPLGDGPASRFARVFATGTLRPGAAALYGAEVRDIGRTSILGAQRLQILDRLGAPPILVDLGWVSADTHAASIPLATGAVTVTGFVRPAEHPGWLAAPDDAEGRRFYTLDPAAIGRALGAPDLARFTLVAMGAQTFAGPVPADAMPAPPNNHLSYALTWFGLAAALVAVYVAWALGSSKQAVLF